MIKKLPPEERAEVVAFVKKAEPGLEKPGVKYLPQAEAERRAEKIFRENQELFRRLAQ